MEIVAQIIGIIAMLFNIFSFQCKNNKHLTIMQGTAGLLFATSFILLKGYSAAGFNAVALLCSLFVINKKTRNNFMFGVVCFLYIIVTIISFNGLWTLALLFAQTTHAYTLWYCNAKKVRILRLCIISPIWLINNILKTFVLGGIISETFCIISVIVSLIRYKDINSQ